MKASVDYWEIERRYWLKGDSNDKELCKHAGINYHSYKSRRSRNEAMNLTVALLIADYLECDIRDFTRLE